ncbi:MAG: hypothetical protein A2464_14580 [Deltaproteobacteria bacterium RIFOXYC2_FULL_48_10]|nr:MAG: hypothetical protein A2464_14580 [Deltaproteobacteria bacterium RIFOXYC2_FULL_48_10]
MRYFINFFLICFAIATSFSAEEVLAGEEMIEWDGVKLPMDCDKNMMTAMECMRELRDNADKELNSLYTIQIEYLQNDSTKNDLKEAQRAWIKFRDKDCNYQAGKQPSMGHYWAYTNAKCQYKRTITRIRELKEYVECRTDDCPY